MTEPIDNYTVIDLDAPVLPAYEAFVDGSAYWLVWCMSCPPGRGMTWPEQSVGLRGPAENVGGEHVRLFGCPGACRYNAG